MHIYSEKKKRLRNSNFKVFNILLKVLEKDPEEWETPPRKMIRKCKKMYVKRVNKSYKVQEPEVERIKFTR